ncbi:MAG: glycine--tRNA ligase [Dehalococcoidales bacterium]|nr:glycine--tRNA ligase [Dehalococcoidales bacterium]
MDKLLSLARRRGFLFQSSEIYGGLASCWDYGPLGVELKRNVKQAWWRSIVQGRDDVVGLDTSILMHPKVWEASGHVSGFSDPMVDCKSCKMRFRKDDLKGDKCPSCDGELTEPRMFNLMFKTFMGPLEEAAAIVYLRPETAQGMFVNFANVLNTTRRKIPFGIAQQGKSFRNEITPSNLIFRTREFEQMELEFFVKPGTDTDWFNYWVNERFDWYCRLGIKKENLNLSVHPKEDLAHYAKSCTDVTYNFPMGWGELEGIANRSDFDLQQHAKHSGKTLDFFDEETKERYVPFIIEPSAGVDRSLLAFLCDAYEEEIAEGELRVVLHLHPDLAPIKAAILPLSKKENLASTAKQVYSDLRKSWNVQYDDSQSIGRRYRRQDEIGTPFCITVDFQSLEDGQVTIRERDKMDQIRVPIKSLTQILAAKFSGEDFLELPYGGQVWKRAGENNSAGKKDEP